MKYVAQDVPEDNVNISRRSPLVELATLLGGALALLVAIYFILGLLVDFVAPRVSFETEMRLGNAFADSFESELNAEQKRKQAYLQDLLDQLVKQKYGQEPHLDFKVHLNPDQTANAFAFPGGHIMVMEGLLDQAESENEVVFVLGHEMGHLHHRHNLKALGRGLVLFVTTEAIFGGNSGISKNMGSLMQGLQANFSRSQELQADLSGLQSTFAHFDHVGGSTDFLTRHRKDAGSSWGQYFASHPHPDARIAQMKHTMEQLEMQEKAKKPLPDFISGELPSGNDKKVDG